MFQINITNFHMVWWKVQEIVFTIKRVSLFLQHQNLRRKNKVLTGWIYQKIISYLTTHIFCRKETSKHTIEKHLLIIHCKASVSHSASSFNLSLPFPWPLFARYFNHRLQRKTKQKKHGTSKLGVYLWWDANNNKVKI